MQHCHSVLVLCKNRLQHAIDNEFFPLPKHTRTINLNKVVSKAEKGNKSGSKKRIIDKINKSNALCPYRMHLIDFHSTKRQVEVAVKFLYKVTL